MRRAIRIRAYQNMPNFRKPAAIAIQDSYKLPPYSTVIGMIHKACDFDRYHPMELSVAGRYHTSITDMYTRYFFGMTVDPDRHQLYTERGATNADLLGSNIAYFIRNNLPTKDKDGITRGLGYAEVLVDLELLIYVFPEQEDFDTVMQGLLKPSVFPSLGRHEDILRIDEVACVELSEGDEYDEEAFLAYDTYVPRDNYAVFGSRGVATEYILNKVFVTDSKKGRRITERVRARLVKQNARLSKNPPLWDLTDGEPIAVFPV